MKGKTARELANMVVNLADNICFYLSNPLSIKGQTLN